VKHLDNILYTAKSICGLLLVIQSFGQNVFESDVSVSSLHLVRVGAGVEFELIRTFHVDIPFAATKRKGEYR